MGFCVFKAGVDICSVPAAFLAPQPPTAPQGRIFPKLRLLWTPVRYCPFLRANYIDFFWRPLGMEFFFLVQHHQYLGRDKSGGAGWTPFPGKCYFGLHLTGEKFSFWYQDEDFSDLSDFSWEEGSSGETSSEETSSEDEDGEVEVVLQPHMRTRSSRGRRP